MNSVFSTSNAGYCSSPQNESGCIHLGCHGERGITSVYFHSCIALYV